MRSNKVQEKLEIFKKKQGLLVQRKFNELLFKNVENPRVLSILKYLKNNSKDNFRPTLMALSCEVLGGKADDTILPSLIITLAGAGVGIHDDIVDVSVEKSHRPTLFGKYDYDDALLIGDLLIVKGFSAIEEIITGGYDARKISAIISVVQQHYIQICEGVFMDKHCKKNIDVDLDYFHKFLWKYASDGEACTKIGAILGNGTSHEVDLLADFGRRLCYVFRLAEEITDIISLEFNLLHRLENESIPLPILYASKTSKGIYKKIKSILNHPINNSSLEELMELCFKTSAFTYVSSLAKHHIKEGIGILNFFEPSNARDYLTIMIEDAFLDI